MGKKLTTEEFIKRSKIVHGGKYDYSKVEYVNNRTKVCVICPEHGEFWQRPTNHLKGEGCPVCRYIKSSEKNKDTLEEFVEKAKQIHGNKYDYSKVKYVSSRRKVIIICPIHGTFEQRPNEHLSRCGCPKCGRTVANDKITLSTEEFIEKAKKIHGDKYDYSKVNYINSHSKVCIICPEHGEFWQTPNSHLNGIGCPNCNVSKLEGAVNEILLGNNINFTYQYRNKKFLGDLSLDFYLPDYNIAIECQGEQHFEPINYFGGEKSFEKQKKRDKLKEVLCKSNGVKICYYFENKKHFGTYVNEAHNEKELINGIKALKCNCY